MNNRQSRWEQDDNYQNTKDIEVAEKASKKVNRFLEFCDVYMISEENILKKERNRNTCVVCKCMCLVIACMYLFYKINVYHLTNHIEVPKQSGWLGGSSVPPPPPTSKCDGLKNNFEKFLCVSREMVGLFVKDLNKLPDNHKNSHDAE